MRRVEMLGLPGSGKSTVADLLVQQRYRRGIPAVSLEDAVYLALRAAGGGSCPPLLSPRRFANVFDRKRRKLIVRRTSDELRFNALARFMEAHQEFTAAAMNTIWRCELAAEDRARSLGRTFSFWTRYQLVEAHVERRFELILDEGFVLRAAAVIAKHGAEGNEDILSTYLRLLPRPSVLFVLSVEIDCCHMRSIDRKSGPPKWLRAMPYDRQQEMFVRFAAAIETVADAMESRGVDVIRLDSSRAVDDVVQRALQILEHRDAEQQASATVRQ